LKTESQIEQVASNTFGVMPGLDPGIRNAAPQEIFCGFYWLLFIMDCRAKPGNDDGDAEAAHSLNRQSRVVLRERGHRGLRACDIIDLRDLALGVEVDLI